MPAVRAESRSLRPGHGSGSPSSPRAQSRTQTRVACGGCRIRKIKCNGERPKCARCQKLKIICEYDDKGPSSISSPVQHLEHRLNALESENQGLRARLDHSMVSDHHFMRDIQHDQLSQTVFDGQPVVLPTVPPRALYNNVPGPIISDHDPSTSSMITHVSPNAVVAVSSGTDSGRYGLAQLPSNAQLLDQLPPTVTIPSPLTEQHMVHHTTLAAAFDRNCLPDEQHWEALLQHFIQHTNAVFPVCHVPSLRDLAWSVRSPSNPLVSKDLLTLLHVLAVTCASLPGKSPLHHAFAHQAPVFYALAGQVESHIPSISSHTKLRILILKTQFVLYRPECGNVWELSGQAIRAAVDAGLHNDSTRLQKSGVLQRDMGRRLFWSAYCMDRSLSYALGRPPGIADDWITAQMPLDEDDSFIGEELIHPGGQPCPLKLAAISHFRLRKLQSEIHHRLYAHAALNLGVPTKGWYEFIVRKVEDWRNDKPPTNGFASQHWLDLNYHHTRTLVFRPAPNCPQPDREGLQHALAASTGVIKAYRGMYRDGRINYNWVAMYQLFTAGVTYLNSLWQAHRSGWTIVPSPLNAVLDIQVCASIMEGLAAATPGTSGIRDAFESVSERILRHLTSHTGRFSAPNSPSVNPTEPCAMTQMDSSASGSNGTGSVDLPATIDNIPFTWNSSYGLPNNPIEFFAGRTGDEMTRAPEQAGLSMWDEDDPLAAFFSQPIGDFTDQDWHHVASSGNI